MEAKGEVNIAVQDGEVIFMGKVPGNVKRAIRKKWKTDKEWKEEVIKKLDGANAGLAK